MRGLRCAVAVLLISLLAACGGLSNPSPNPDPNSGPDTPPNNSAVLSGDTLGEGVVPNTQLRKEISASLTGASSNFRLGKAYAIRERADSETLDWFISVTNESNQLRCFIEATVIQFKNSAGQTLVTVYGSYVKSRVGVSQGSDIYTDTCLSSGETGYLFGIELADDVPLIYTSVSSIVISSIEGDTGFDEPAAKIIPQSYSVVGKQLAVTIKNEGASKVRVDRLSPYFLLDDDKFPLAWRYFDELSWNGLVGAGETQVMNDIFRGYDGKATKLQVQIDFDSPTSSPNISDQTFLDKEVSAEIAKKQHLEGWLQEEEAKRHLIDEATDD